MKVFHLALAFLCMIPFHVANAAEYYEWPDPVDSVTVTTQDNDLWPASNLIQGPGEGFDAAEPHDRIGGGSTHLWVTAADAGFPADYIDEVGQPVIQFDLGADRTLKEISVWGYSSTNANGTSQFSLRFATDAEGGPDGFFENVNYGQSITYNPTFELFSNPLPQQYNLFEETVVARYVELTNLDNFYIPPGDGSAPTEEPDPRLLPVLPGGDRVGLGEVAFMILPESFQPGDLIPRQINGDDFGVFSVSSTRAGQVFGPAGDPVPGLAQEWYAVANPGSKAGLDDIFNSNDPVVPAFQADGSSWWTGSSTVLSGVPDYPDEVQGFITGDNYSVRLTGEILIEESGLYRFTDGVDDFTYLAIDIDRSGVAGDSNGEVLIEDNSWTDVLTGANAGGAIAEVEIQGVAAGGEWLTIEFNAAEGGGGDSGVLYWDFKDGIGGNEFFFPLVPADPIFDELDAEELLIPDSHLRSAIAELIAADAEGSLAEAIGQPDVLELNVQVGPNGNDQIVLDDVTVGDGTSRLDVSGTTIRVQVEGAISEGSRFTIFAADEVVGIDGLTLLFDDPDRWSLAALSDGVIVFGSVCDPTTGGDLDGNGTVEFADFLALSANFGTSVADQTFGDIDCNGTVEFADFLALSANFGNTVGGAAAASVPEPSGMILLVLAGLIGSIFRRRL